MNATTDLSCTNRPLGTVLANLAEAHRISIWLDRRVDPDQTVNLAISAAPLRMVLTQLAGQLRLGTSSIGSVVYFGPAEAAAKLRTLSALRHDELRPLPAARRKPLAESRSSHWDDLATPRELIGALAREAKVECDGLSLVPHDLWAAREMPALDWLDRLTLIGIGFDLTFRVSDDGKSVTLVPVPETVIARRVLPAGGRGAEAVKILAQQFPQTEIRLAGEKIVLEGRVEDLEAALAGVTGKRTVAKPSAPPKQAYQLTAEKTLRDLLTELGSRLDLDFQLDRPAIERAGVSMDQVVSVKVHDASLDELIHAVLTPAGLKGTRRGRVVSVVPSR